MLYDMMNNDLKRQSDYQKMWKWTRGKLRQEWAKIEAQASLFYLKSQQPNNNQKNGPNGSKNGEVQPENNQHIVYDNIIPITSASPKPSANNKNINNPHTRKLKIYGSKEKCFLVGKDCLNRLAKLGSIYPSLLNNPDKSRQMAAKVFDLLHRKDGYSWARIEKLLNWLLDEDNWWILNLKFRSPAKLRKPNDEGVLFFEFFDGQMEAEKKPKVKTKSWMTYSQMQSDAKRRNISFSAINPVDKYYERNEDTNMWRLAV